MPQIDATRSYDDGVILYAADLDAFIDDFETLLNVTKLDDDNIQDAGITASLKLIDSTVTTAKLAASAVTTAKITDDAVTAAKVADGAIDDAAKLASSVVTAAKLASDSVTTVKILDANVTAAKLASDSVTTVKILAANVTAAKLSTQNKTISSTSGGYTRSASSYADVLSCPITVAARPVRIYFQPDGTNIASWDVGSGGTGMTLRVTRDGADIGRISLSAVGAHGPGSFVLRDDPGAGSYTYACSMLSNDNATTMGFYYMKMVVEEIH